VVVIDDEIHHPISCHGGAFRHPHRRTFQPFPDFAVADRRPMADGDEKAGADKHVGLPQLYPIIPQQGSLHHDEQGASVLLHLGSLVAGACVLDGQFVQIEFLLQGKQQIFAGFLQGHQMNVSSRFRASLMCAMRYRPGVDMCIGNAVSNHSRTVFVFGQHRFPFKSSWTSGYGFHPVFRHGIICRAFKRLKPENNNQTPYCFRVGCTRTKKMAPEAPNLSHRGSLVVQKISPVGWAGFVPRGAP